MLESRPTSASGALPALMLLLRSRHVLATFSPVCNPAPSHPWRGAMSQGSGQQQSQEPVLWDRVEWRQGDGRYTFQVASGGLLATLTSPHGSALTLPMVAWEGLLDALSAQRKT